LINRRLTPINADRTKVHFQYSVGSLADGSACELADFESMNPPESCIDVLTFIGVHQRSSAFIGG